VVSTHDTARQVDRKLRQYLEAGCGSVWLIYRELRHVLVFRSDGSAQDFLESQSIREPALFDEQPIQVAALFADLP
jgi:Uma2 family endonuclease